MTSIHPLWFTTAKIEYLWQISKYFEENVGFFTLHSSLPPYQVRLIVDALGEP